jgi:starvation-inducible DNA-binding protein
VLLADVFTLYLKTKNFHWHMSGPHFRDYHLLLDEHGDHIFAMTDAFAERVRKIGGGTIRSIGHISRLQRLSDNDADYVDALDMLAELREDNRIFWRFGSMKRNAASGSSSKSDGRDRVGDSLTSQA